MFEGCTALKGAVAYDDSPTDVRMANPETGYFTKKVEDKPEVTTPEAYVQMSTDKTTLSFFYDTNRASREGTTWGIEEKQEFEGDQFPAWVSTDENGDTTTTKAVFDASFANFRPTSTTSWFEEFKALTAIEGLQDLNTSEVKDMSGMFAGCAALTSVDLSKFNTSEVKDMSGMFSGCFALTNLDLSSFKTSNVTNMSYMFRGCSALTSLDLKSFNTSNVMNMSHMFNDCSALKSLDLKYFNTSNVTNMETMFGNCSALTSLNLSSFNTSNVTNMDGMFDACSSLISLDLKNFNTEKVTNMTQMFYYCKSLTSLDLSGFNTEKVKDMRWMFEHCSKLVNIVSNKAWKCEESREMFKGCTALKGAVAYDEIKTDATMANPETGYFTKKAQDKPEVTTPEAYVQMSADKTTLTFFYDTKRDTREGTTWGIEEKKEFEGVQYSAWTGTYKDLNNTTTKAVVDASFKDFRPTSTASWFQYFYALTNIEGLQNLNTSNVTDMNGMFQGCSLTSLDLKNFNTSNVTDMNGMFAGCYALTALDLSSFNTSNVRGMNGMFANCSALTSLDLKNFNTSNVRTMNIMFSGCSALTNLDLKNFNTEEVWDMSYMFWDCSALTSLDLMNFNTSNVKDMRRMFAHCSKLASIVSNKTWNCEQSREMFKGCTALKGAVPYDERKVDVTMANPETGYFTRKAQDKPEVTSPEAYVQMSADKTTLTFFYDTKRASREGTTWGIEEKQEVEKRLEFPAWAGTYNNPNKTTTKVVFDASFKDIHPTSTGFWFKNFKALTAIEGLQNLNTSEVTDMSVMFAGCSALTSLDLKNFNTSKVTNMSGMFEDCSALTSLDLSNFNTSNVALMTAMFEYCSALTSLDLKGFKTEKVQDMKYMFNNCSALTSLDLSHFNTEKVEDMSGMFAKCSKLASIVNNKTWNCEESQDMFKGCTALKGAVAYDESKTDVKMANPETGYFTKKVQDKPEVTSPEAYAQMSADQKTLTFFYDTKRASREGTTWGIEEKKEDYGRQIPAWARPDNNLDTTTTKAVFDPSFKDFRPTSTAHWFEGFNVLTAIEGLQNLNTSNVTSMNSMFYSCSALTALDLKNFNTEKVEDMIAMFLGCEALTSLDLSNFNTLNLKDINNMFGYCSALKSIDLSGFKTEKVEDMQHMFNNCSALTSLDLSNFNTENVTNMSGMFADCSALTSLNLKNFNTDKVEYMVIMFQNCSNLASIVCNKTWKCERSQDMFKGCTALKGAVAYDASQTDVTMANPETGYFTKKVEDKPEVTSPEAYVQRSADKTTLTFFYDTKRATREGTTWGIEEKLEFEGDQFPAWLGTYENPDTTTTKAVVDASFANFRPTSTASWFQSFEALAAIEGLQNLNTSEVTNMRAMFNGCSRLTNLDLSSFNTSNVTDMGWMFNGCSALTSLDLKNFNTSNVTDMSLTFKGCSTLTTLELKNFNTSNVTDMSLMFKDCSALKSLDLKNFNTSNVTDMSLMFNGCSGLKSLDLSNFNISKVTNMGGMFYGCSKLASIVCDKAWNSEYSYYMFKDCTALKGAVAYDESKTDVTMANPETGYFTKKAQGKPEVTTPEAYVQMSADKTTLTFFYDTKRSTREGTTWGIEEKKEDNGQPIPAWAGTHNNPDTTTTKAVVDASFKNFQPSSTVSWFECFEALTAIEGLQNLNTSNVTDMRAMFSGCSRLTNLDLSSFNTSNVTHMSWMFYDCSALTNLDLKNFNTSNVTHMSWMFYGCSALTSLDFSNVNTSEVTNMHRMFSGCSALTSLDLKNFNTQKVENMSYMFENCSALTALDLKNFNTSNVTDMGYMFSGCSALKSLDLKNFNTEKVEGMSGMFAYCSKLVNIVSDKTWKSDTSREMFKGCKALKGAVAYDESKTDVTMANPETGYFTKKVQDKPEVTTPEAYVQMSADKKTLTFFYDTKRYTRQGQTWGIEEKKEDNGSEYPAWAGTYLNPNKTITKAVVDASFKDFRPTSTAKWLLCHRSLINIEGLQYLNTSEVKDMGGMFAACSRLTNLDLSNFDISNATNINGMFADCSALTSINLTAFNTEKVTDMSYMFTGCSALTTLAIKNFNTEKVTNMSWMFYGCAALTNLDLKNFNTSNVKDMSRMFQGCSALTSLDLKNFNTSKVTDMNYMFYRCAALTSLDLKNFNIEKVENMISMFEDCSQLATIVSNKTWNCEQSQGMFEGCTALKGAVAYDESKTDVTMANPETGYFTKKAQDKPEVTTPEAYVQMSADKTTLTFFYDTKRASREGTTWDITSPIATRSASSLNAPAWGASEEKPNSTTTKVVFDASFAKFYPQTTAEWFAHYAALKRIEGIENLNTSEVTSMKGMFTGCAALDTLDLTSFNTEKVNDMSEMFKNCANLSTVVCDKVWSTPHSEQMFYGCVKLLGKAAFDANKTSVEMANPNSGYFVAVKPTALLPVFSPAGANGIYTLQGKRVRGNLQHLPAGVYIVNGKKVVVQ